MQLKYLKCFVIALAVISTISLNVEARRFKLRPLSAREVYKILRKAGREDAVPEGRIVTQGIAAIAGFALGLTTGIGGSLLFDLATSNATSQFINNFNMSALTGVFSNGTSVNLSSRDTSSYQTQEICFESRSLERDKQVRNTLYSENYKYGRQFPSTNTPTTSSIISTSPTGTNFATGSPNNSDRNAETNSRTGTGASKTCIVIQMPRARKRRSSHRRRKR